MDERNLRQILGSIGVQPGRANGNGWMEFPCPLSPWTHTNGHDSRASCAAKVSDTGVSAFVCKACHNHGPIAKLVRLLADYRQDNSIRPLMLMADRADSESQVSAGFPAFEDYNTREPDPEPLEEAAYGDMYPLVAETGPYADYLRARGISAATAAALDLRVDERQRRVLFPVRDRHRNLYGYTGRAIAPGVNPKVRDYLGLPKKFVILGEEWWRPNVPKVIVEGLFAYAHIHELDIHDHCDVGAILGSAMTEFKAERIIHADCPTYLLLDNDAGGDIGLFGTLTPSGEREQNGAVHYLQQHVPLYIPDWPEGKDDPDQLTRDEVLSMLDNSSLWTADGADKSFDKEWDEWV